MNQTELINRIEITLKKSTIFRMLSDHIEEQSIKDIAQSIFLIFGNQKLAEDDLIDRVSNLIAEELEKISIDIDYSDSDGIALSLFYIVEEFKQGKSEMFDKINVEKIEEPAFPDSDSSIDDSDHY